MTFTFIERYSATDTVTRMVDVLTLDDLYAIGHDIYGDAPMTINWATLTATVELG